MYYAKVNDTTVQLGDDLRMSKPYKSVTTGPQIGPKFYGYQENASLMDGRWEGFVSVIQTPNEYERRLKHFGEMMGKAEKQTHAQAAIKEAQRMQEKIAPKYKWKIKDHDRGETHEIKTWETQEQAMATLSYTIAGIAGRE